jgi:hypothetical protein
MQVHAVTELVEDPGGVSWSASREVAQASRTLVKLGRQTADSAEAPRLNKCAC